MSDAYEGFRQESTFDPEELKTLRKLALAQVKAEHEVAAAEEALKQAKIALADIAEKQLPELMDSIGLESFTTEEGFKIEVKRTIRASVPVANRPKAYNWLEEHGHGGMIKRTLVVGFDRDQRVEAAELRHQLEKKYDNVKEDQKVEPSTLRAFIAERLAEGEEIPLQLFGAFEQRKAKITTKRS
jgi:hypothetical protein